MKRSTAAPRHPGQQQPRREIRRARKTDPDLRPRRDR